MKENKHILIVDDDAEFAGMVAQAVQDVSDTYVVQVSTDARAATAEVREAQASARSYDLVITDIKMPGSSGLQLLEALAEIAPETKTITMTAYHSPELASQAQQLHVQAYLIKPIALSEFRQVVRAALSSPKPGTETPSSSGQLSPAQRAAIEGPLANLRATTNSRAALLVHTDGEILALDSLEADLDARMLCQALVDAQRSITQAARRALSGGAPIQQSSYSTETYGICTFRMEDAYVLVTIFGPSAREGHVWYQMRETAEELAATLARLDGDEADASPEAGDDWRSQIERYFTGASRGRRRNRRNARAGSKRPLPAETRVVPPAEQAPPLTRPDIGSNDPMVLSDPAPQAEYPAQMPVEPVQRSVNRASPSLDQIDRPSVDEINWDISADLDWDEMVTDVDQGFAGMGFEEAKRRGLIDELQTDE